MTIFQQERRPTTVVFLYKLIDMITSHFGKPYQQEPAVISITSWKNRISTVGITLYSIFKYCPGFHAVLVLSEEEFPAKEAELPSDLITMCKKHAIEILWVHRNFKSYKKWCFTAFEYPNIPIISGDDDCLYFKNYALTMYKVWEQNQNCIVTLGKGANGLPSKNMLPWPTGSKSLYPPNTFASSLAEFIVHTNPQYYTNDDDTLYSIFAHINHIPIISPFTDDERNVYQFHDTNSPLNQTKSYGYEYAYPTLMRLVNAYNFK